MNDRSSRSEQTRSKGVGKYIFKGLFLPEIKTKYFDYNSGLLRMLYSFLNIYRKIISNSVGA